MRKEICAVEKKVDDLRAAVAHLLVIEDGLIDDVSPRNAYGAYLNT